MTVKMKLSEVVQALPALNALAQQPLKASASFALAKTLRLITAEYEAYDKARIACCAMHGMLNAETQQYEFADGAAAAFQMEIGELMQSEVELAITPLPLAMLEGAQLSAAQAWALQWLVAE